MENSSFWDKKETPSFKNNWEDKVLLIFCNSGYISLNNKNFLLIAPRTFIAHLPERLVKATRRVCVYLCTFVARTFWLGNSWMRQTHEVLIRDAKEGILYIKGDRNTNLPLQLGSLFPSSSCKSGFRRGFLDWWRLMTEVFFFFQIMNWLKTRNRYPDNQMLYLQHSYGE